MRTTPHWRRTSLVAAAVLLLSACSSTGDTGDTGAGGEERGSLTYASDQTPDTFNPAMLVEHTNPGDRDGLPWTGGARRR